MCLLNPNTKYQKKIMSQSWEKRVTDGEMAGRKDRAESIAPPDRGEDPKEKKGKQIPDFHLFIWVQITI